ncbi:MAG TPA: DUF3536 domain-containing protein, partial [Thermoanaerobaculia bacterium]|nr:DUF3536 domain-containing protein [Thermoanaerobaculia bacterium]
ECYEPNASSRILDAHDRIVKIVNNYASISFNFGPTLLSWLEEKAPATYAAILDADRASRERFGGHGSAIAQAYNHVILPLANDRDRRTQVRWGVRDFEKRFGRKPEGMWLPETAVDIPSLEALAAEGILFTILEPHQAKPVNGGAIDSTRPYWCRLPSGKSIAIFFYDGPISRAVAFERLLARGENLAHRLLGAFSESKHAQLVNIATDGETYGHHHRYGDMALAYAIDYINERKLARIANFGHFLAENPPADDVQIVEQTSWSCSHGVGRWQLDCGCSVGAPSGWTQQWRAPLRDALNWLRDECAAIFEEFGKRVLVDPWQARDDYIDVVLDRSDDNVEQFVKLHATADGLKSVPHLLELLELQRNAMLMFTSCAWFFNDVSGIETVQILAYAGRVLQLAEKICGRPLELEFMKRVSSARSNLGVHGDARQIYEREVKPMRLDLRRVAAHYAAASLFSNYAFEEQIYCFRARQEDFETYRAGRAKMAIGNITVTSLITRETSRFEFTVIHLGETELTGGVRPASDAARYEAMKRDLSEDMRVNGIASVIRVLDEYFEEPLLSIRSLFRDEQRRILDLLCDATLHEAESAFRQLHERYDPLMRFHAALGVPLPGVLRSAAEFDVNLQLRRLFNEDEPPLAEIEILLRESRDEGVRLDETTQMVLERAVERAARDFAAKPEDFERLERWEAIVTLIREAQVKVDLRQPQNEYYKMRRIVRPVIAANAGNGSQAANRWLQHFDALGEKLAISAEAHG